jgi:hypothetical protein
MKTMLAAAFAVWCTVAGAAGAQTLTISTFADPQWDWIDIGFQRAIMTVGTDERFNVSVRNAGSTAIGGPYTLIVQSQLQPGMAFAGANADWACSSSPNSSLREQLVCEHVLQAGSSLAPNAQFPRLELQLRISDRMPRYPTVCFSVTGVSPACTPYVARFEPGLHDYWVSVQPSRQPPTWSRGTVRRVAISSGNQIGAAIPAGARLRVRTVFDSELSHLTPVAAGNDYGQWTCSVTGQAVTCDLVLQRQLDRVSQVANVQIDATASGNQATAPRITAWGSVFDAFGKPLAGQEGFYSSNATAVTIGPPA